MRPRRASALPGFIELLDGWVGAVKADPEAFRTAASRDAVEAAYKFGMEDSRDLVDYLAGVDALLPGSQGVKRAGASLKGYIKDRLVLRATPPAAGRTHGLAIYIPDLVYNSANYEKLAISRDSLGDDFLRAMMAERLSP